MEVNVFGAIGGARAQVLRSRGLHITADVSRGSNFTLGTAETQRGTGNQFRTVARTSSTRQIR